MANPLPELDSQLLPLAELVDLVVATDRVVEVVVHALLHRRCSPGVQSNVALVELGDPHAHRLALTNGRLHLS